MEKAPQNLEVILQYFEDFTPQQLEQFAALDGLYKEWNNKINVISRKDIEGLYEKHILHSLSLAVAASFPPGSEILDIGTGGGFPGIPLAIFFPEVQFLLVDSIGKKLKVVEGVVEALHLKNVLTLHGRVEEIRNRKFDYAVSRAVAPLKDLWNWSKPLIRKKPAVSNNSSGTDSVPGEHLAPGLLCLKGGDLKSEIIESGTRPRITEVFDIFPLPAFKEKFVLYVHK
jgi:16S rRNA (guanine527-N7)-methyltransferase